jgi:hypothetical protein
LNPKSVYERPVSRGLGQDAGAAKLDGLLLDRVLEDANNLRSQVGTQDRIRIDEYLSVMRSLEERTDRAADATQNPWKPRVALDASAAPTDQPRGHAEHVRLMMDMIATAFQTDTTRVATFMFGNSVSDISFRFLEGVSSSHHETSHHQKDPEKLRQYALINQVAHRAVCVPCRKLKNMREGESNVLDNSMILFASALATATVTGRTTCRWCWRARAAAVSTPGGISCLPRIARCRIICVDAGCLRCAGGALCR